MSLYYYSVYRKNGVKICDCADEIDALMMVSFDKSNRTYSRNQYLLDQVITISSEGIKELPGQLGLPFEKELYIPQGIGEPVIV